MAECTVKDMGLPEFDQSEQSTVTEPCRTGGGCWRPLCPFRHSGDSRAARCAAVWALLAAHDRIDEQIVDVPVPQMLAELVSQERVQQRTAEQNGDAPQFLEETVEMPKISCQESVEFDLVLLRTVMQYPDTGLESPSRFFGRIRERILEQEEKEKILQFFPRSVEGSS